MPDYVGGNRLTLLRNGEQYFPELVRAIDAARREIHLETYIFADDQTGSLVADALARAAARGVAVRLLLDIYHMWVMHGDYLDRLPGVLVNTAHIHVADVPGRGEPGGGTIPWTRVAQVLRAGGYRGAIGLECWPSGDVGEALRRAREVLAA